MTRKPDWRLEEAAQGLKTMINHAMHGAVDMLYEAAMSGGSAELRARVVELEAREADAKALLERNDELEQMEIETREQAKDAQIAADKRIAELEGQRDRLNDLSIARMHELIEKDKRIATLEAREARVRAILGRYDPAELILDELRAALDGEETRRRCCMRRGGREHQGL